MSDLQINLLRLYLKGASLELPALPDAFLQPTQPHQDHLDMQLTVRAMENNIFEVSLRATLTLKMQETVIAVLEAEQAGLVQLLNANHDDVVTTILHVQIAAAVYGHLRVNMTDLLTRATLPAYYLPEIDWAAQLKARMAQDASPAVAAANNA